jgi:nitroreductase
LSHGNSIERDDSTVGKGLPAVDAIRGRRSTRRFLPTPVGDEEIRAILRDAARAPSGMNMQPWCVHVVQGEARARLSRQAREAASKDEGGLEYAYLPAQFTEPYLSRRRALGLDLYARYGIDRHDRAARQEAMLRNFDFFGAPVGLFFTMERSMSQGSWLDCGMFMQNIMILARAWGLATCPQQSWCDVGSVVHRELAIPVEHILLSGMALGYADPLAPENQLVSERAEEEEFIRWHA